MTDSRITVVVVEDDRHAREWMEAGVARSEQLTLLASFASLAAAEAWFEQHQADVLLTDLGLPDGHGLDLIKQVFSQRRPDGSARTDILVMSVFGDEETVLRCIEAGAVGYIHKDSSIDDIARVVLDVRRGASPISPMIARRLLERYQKVAHQAPPRPAPQVDGIELTPAEHEVLSMISRGYAYAEIARARGVSINTVQSQVKGIYSKLAVHSRGEAVYEAIQLGLIDPRGSP